MKSEERRRKVFGETKLPRNWMDFLRDPSNKTELFDFLTTKVANYTFPQGKSVYITAAESVVAVPSTNPMPNCNHEVTLQMQVQSPRRVSK